MSASGTIRRDARAALAVAAAAAVLALATHAGAGGPPAAAPGRAAADSAAPDSIAKLLREPGGLQRYLATSDSLVRLQGGARADDAQLLLAWNAPWGTPRARRERTPQCADSTVEDTLYLSVLPGRSAPRFNGFTGRLLFRATGADTLGRWWHKGKGGANPGSMRVEWAANPDFGWRQPFPVTGQGFGIVDRTPSMMSLRFVFAVTLDGAGPVAADSVYTLCRVILTHRPERALAGCEAPVCVEWAEATLAFGAKDEPRVRRGDRFVAYGGPGAICEPFRGGRVEAWKPAPPATPGGPDRR